MKKIFRAILAVLLVFSLASCQRKNPKEQLSDFLQAQVTKSNTTGEIVGNLSIGAAVQTIPLTATIRYDIPNHRYSLSGSMMGMMGINVVVIDKVAYVDMMQMKFKVTLDSPATGTSLPTETGGIDLTKFLNMITNVKAEKHGSNTVYSFDINITDMMKMLPKIPDAPAGAFKENPHVSITGDKNDNIVSGELKWTPMAGATINGSFEFTVLGGKVDISEPFDKDTYQEISPEDMAQQFQLT